MWFSVTGWLRMEAPLENTRPQVLLKQSHLEQIGCNHICVF